MADVPTRPGQLTKTEIANQANYFPGEAPGKDFRKLAVTLGSNAIESAAEPNAAGQSEGTQGQGEEVARAAPATVPGRPAAPAASFIVAAGALADEYDCPIHGKLGGTETPLFQRWQPCS